MRSASSIAVLALLAAPALAAPLNANPSYTGVVARAAPIVEEPPAPVVEEPTVAPPKAAAPPKSSGGSGIGNAVAGGAASAAVSNILNKIESFFGFKRDGELSARDISDIAAAIPSLSAEEKAQVKAALIAKVSTLKDSDLSARAFSLKGAGSGIGGAVAGGAASAVVGNLLNEIESLFRREELTRRGLFGSAANSAANGLAGVASKSIVGSLLDKIESLFRREEIELKSRGDVANKLGAMQQRRAFSLKGSSTPKVSSGSGIGSAVAGGAASAAVGNILTKIEGFFGFKRSDAELNEFVERDIKDTIASLSPEDQKTVHDALVAKISTLHDSDLSARAFSLKGSSTPKVSSGSGIGSAVAGGAASAAVGNILSKIEGFFGFKRDEFAERDIKDTIASLSPEDQKTVHDALVAKISTLKDSDAQLAARGFASAFKGAGSGLGGAVAGGAASAVVGNLLNEIESLFRRSDEEMLEARAFSLKGSGVPKPAKVPSSSGSGIGGAVAGGAASAAVGNILTKIESFFGFKRDEFELSARDIKAQIASLSPADQKTVHDALVAKISTLKDTDAQLAARGFASAFKGAGSGLGGAVAGGAASAVVGNLLNEIESLFRRDDSLEGLVARSGLWSIDELD